MPAINPVLAYALMPTDSFAQRRADDMAIIQQQSVLTALSQQQADVRAKVARDLRLNFNAVIAADVLAPDRKRLVERYVSPWKEKIFQTIKTEYGGDPNMVSRFMREKGEWMLGQMADEIAQSKELQQAESNKVSYAQMLKDQQDGKILRGDPQKSLADFYAGSREDLSYGGGYATPKLDAMKFATTPKPGYEYGELSNGKRLPPLVTLDEQAGHLVGSGTSLADARDWLINKGNYNPTLT